MVRWILGTAGTGKTSRVLEEAGAGRPRWAEGSAAGTGTIFP